jgi:hypothetical protein
VRRTPSPETVDAPRLKPPFVERPWPEVVFAASALLLGAAVWAPVLRDAFFIYDDFAHLELCRRLGLADFFRQPIFRPSSDVKICP